MAFDLPVYTLGMPCIRSEDPASGKIFTPARPSGIGLSAIAMAALIAASLLRDFLQLSRHLAGPAVALAMFSAYGVASFCLWRYWKGQNWARIAVLLWSLATAARAIAFLADHNLDPASLMSRPARFFPALLAVVLLYWLNLPAVRAWFRRSSATAADLIAERLRGRLCTGLEYGLGHGLGYGKDARAEAAVSGNAALPAAGACWRLLFEHDAELVLRCPWRIVLDDNLAFASAPEGGRAPAAGPAPAAGSAALPDAMSAYTRAEDDAPPETVPAPSHSPEEARRLLQNLRVTSVRLARVRLANAAASAGTNHAAPRNCDLFVSFEMGIELQTWTAPAPAPAPAAGAALQWRYSDPELVVEAEAAGVRLQSAAVPPEAAGRAAEP